MPSCHSITYGYKVAVWISDFIDCSQRMKKVKTRVHYHDGRCGRAFNTMPGIGLGKSRSKVAELTGMHAMEVPSRNLSTINWSIWRTALMANICHKIGE